MAEQTPQQTAMEQPLEQATWKDRLLRNSVELRQLELADQVIGQSQQRGLLHRLAEIQQNAYAKKVGAEAPAAKSLEDKDVQFGDNLVHYHESPKNGRWWLGPVIGVALAVGGAAGGLALSQAFQGAGDENTRYELGGDFHPEPPQFIP